MAFSATATWHYPSVTRRASDGERVLAVQECPGSAQPLANESCAPASGMPNRTHYAYHTNGQLEAIYDVKAAQYGWSDASHVLRYHFDSVGNVTRIEDPDAGTSKTLYDHVGNVTSTVNARGEMRAFGHDELDRSTSIGSPEGTVLFPYGAGQLYASQEAGPGYT